MIHNGYPLSFSKTQSRVVIGLLTGHNTLRRHLYNVHLESHCALRLRYVDPVVSIEVAVEARCCCVTFHCIQL